MEIKIPRVRMLRKRKVRGDLISAAIERPHLTIIMNNSLKVLPQQAAQSGMINMFGLLKSKKTDTEMCERSGRLDVTSWRTTPNQVSPTMKLSMMEQRNPSSMR